VEEKVPTPGWLNYERYGTFSNIYAGAPAEKAHAWTIAQVKSILKEETHIGHSVHNKQSNISFKNKKKVRKPQEEWHNANIFRASKVCGLWMVIGLWCKQPEQKSLCTLLLQ